MGPVGARIGELMDEGKILAQVCDTMQVEFEVARKDIERDVLDLVEKLQAQKLISIA